MVVPSGVKPRPSPHFISKRKTLTIAGALYILLLHLNALVAQLVEHVLGKDEVTSSILVEGLSTQREL